MTSDQIKIRYEKKAQIKQVIGKLIKISVLEKNRKTKKHGNSIINKI